jgi:hypothetical protein
MGGRRPRGVIRIRGAGSFQAAIGARFGYQRKTVCVGKWQGTQQYGIHDAEYCGVGSNAERHGGNRCNRETLVAAQTAGGVTELVRNK